jgi:hypothetical protein
VLFTEVPGDGQWKVAHVDAINLATNQRTTLPTLLYAAGGRYPTAAATLARVDRQGAATPLADITGGLISLRARPLAPVPWPSEVGTAAAPATSGCMTCRPGRRRGSRPRATPRIHCGHPMG